jgi:hypothetical protein
MTDPYLSFCEALWDRWRHGQLEVPPAVRVAFDLDASPEPYISFNAGVDPLVVLTTNPGGTMDHQRKETIQASSGPIGSANDYATAARQLGPFYEEALKKHPAGRRIAGLKTLASLLGKDGVLEVEACPFHSRYTPGKAELMAVIAQGGLLCDYVGHLAAFLKDRSVVIISAIGANAVLAPGMTLPPWIAWKASLTGLQATDSTVIPLVTKGSRATCAAMVDHRGKNAKVLILMMGGNHLPGEQGLKALAQRLA